MYMYGATNADTTKYVLNVTEFDGTNFKDIPTVYGETIPVICCVDPIVYGTKAYFIGGYGTFNTTVDSAGDALNAIYVLDLTSWTWSMINGTVSDNNPLPRFVTANFLNGSKVIVYGGVDGTYTNKEDTYFYIFNLETGVWDSRVMAPTTRPKSLAWVNPLLLTSKNYFIYGGNYYGNETWYFDVTAGTFTQLATSSEVRELTRLWEANGYIYGFGGVRYDIDTFGGYVTGVMVFSESNSTTSTAMSTTGSTTMSTTGGSEVVLMNVILLFVILVTFM